MREWNFVFVCIGAVDVVEADGDLGYNLQRSLARFKNLGINLVTQSRNEAVDPRFNFFDDQAFWRSHGVGIDFNVVAALAQDVEGVSDIAGRKHTKLLVHFSPGSTSASEASAQVGQIYPDAPLHSGKRYLTPEPGGNGEGGPC